MTIPIFVISLDEAKDRQEHVKQQLDAQGLDFEIFPAFDGRSLNVEDYPAYDRPKRLRNFGRDMRPGEIGCLLSHRSIYEKMIAENIAAAIVLEDDVIIEPDFAKVIGSLETCDAPYELVRFLGSEKVAKLKQRKVFDFGNGYSLNRLMTTPGGAHAYLITLSGAKKMYKAMQKNDLPVDTLMGHVWRTGLNAFIVQPRLAEQDMSFDNFIGSKRFDKSLELTGIQKMIFPFNRAFFKLHETLRKRLTYIALAKQDAISLMASKAK